MTLSIRAIALGAAGLGAIALGAIGFARGGGHGGAGTPPAVYGSDPALAPDEPIVQASVAPARSVTVSFSNAPVSQVLDWLRKQDANFVVATSSLPSDLRLTLNVKDEPLSVVEKVIANAMGGNWANHDGILVFQKGLGGDSPFALLGSDGHMFKVLPNGSSQFFAGPDGKSFELKLKDLDKLGDQLGPEFQKKMQDQFGPEFQKKMQDQFGPEFQKKLQDKFGPEFQKKLQDQFGPEFQKKLQDEFGPEFQKKLQDQFGPEFQKKMRDQFGPEFQKKMEEQAKKWEGQTRVFSDGKSGGVFRFTNQDLDGLMASLTTDQRDLMKRRGYLTPKDLTEKQRKMLGNVSGKFEVKVKTDKGEMTVKSE